MTLSRISADSVIDALMSEIEALVPKVNAREKFKHSIELTQGGDLEIHRNRLFVLEVLGRDVSPVFLGARQLTISIYIAYQTEIIDGDIDQIRYALLTGAHQSGIISMEINSTVEENYGTGNTNKIVTLEAIVNYMPPNMG